MKDNNTVLYLVIGCFICICISAIIATIWYFYSQNNDSDTKIGTTDIPKQIVEVKKESDEILIKEPSGTLIDSSELDKKINSENTEINQTGNLTVTQLAALSPSPQPASPPASPPVSSNTVSGAGGIATAAKRLGFF